MMPALRRVWLPWLLLLVPTLLIGAVALRLLWLEQRRIDEAAVEVRQRAEAATRARAQVAADNIELLVSEIRDGLMRELAETPEGDLEALLANWPRTNPLVAETFLWRPDRAALAWPPADNAEHRSFRQRHAVLFGAGEGSFASTLLDQSSAAQWQAKLEPAPVSQTQAAPEDFTYNTRVATNQAARLDVQKSARSSAAAAKSMANLDEARRAAQPERIGGASEALAKVRSDAELRQIELEKAWSDDATKMKREMAAQANRAAERSKMTAERRPQAPAPASVVQSQSGLRMRDAEESKEAARRAAESEAVAAHDRAAHDRYAERAMSDAEKRREEELAKANEASARFARVRIEPVGDALETVTPSPAPGTEPAAEAPKSAARARAPPPSAHARFQPPGAAAPEMPKRNGNGHVAPLLMDAAAVPWSEPVSGWLGRTVNGSVYFLGWWQPAGGGAVRGVELNLPAVLERVQALVPGRTDAGERFAVRGPGESSADANVRIPLSTTLPGWTLVGWTGGAGRIESLDTGGGFFVVAALLVGAFVAAIVAGGSIFFRQAATAAREAALKTSFVSNVSHEMKTPLTTIRMYAEMLADDRVSDPARRSRYFATIGRETSRLTRLVNNVLDFGRLEAGRKEYRPEAIPLGAWLARIVEVHAPRAAEAGVRVVATTPAVGAAVRCDPDSLDQMALNLIDNAVKYAAAGGLVELHADPVPGGWALVVADRGPGVPAAHRERIFERFHRVDESLTAKTQGAGLGLTIARRLARDQGGDLVCREREGGGAAFVLTLPAANPATAGSGATT